MNKKLDTYTHPLLNVGSYYYVNEGSFWMIGKVINNKDHHSSNGNIRCLAICISSQNILATVRWCYKSYNRYYRPATTDEIQWLNACIKQNKYIKKENCVNINMKYKFNIGDEVIVAKSSYGCRHSEIGTKVKIVERGFYNTNINGYVVSPPIGNSLTGVYNGFIGENSFELCKQTKTLEKNNILDVSNDIIKYKIKKYKNYVNIKVNI